jgi:hypothetical protein
MIANTTDAVAPSKLLLLRSTMITLLQDYARIMQLNLTAEEADFIYLTASDSIPFIHPPLLALSVAIVCLVCKILPQCLDQQFLDQVKQCKTRREVEIVTQTALIINLTFPIGELIRVGD